MNKLESNRDRFPSPAFCLSIALLLNAGTRTDAQQSEPQSPDYNSPPPTRIEVFPENPFKAAPKTKADRKRDENDWTIKTLECAEVRRGRMGLCSESSRRSQAAGESLGLFPAVDRMRRIHRRLLRTRPRPHTLGSDYRRPLMTSILCCRRSRLASVSTRCAPTFVRYIAGIRR